MPGPKQLQNILQIAVFLACVVLFGGVTAFRYADFIINDRRQEYHINYREDGGPKLETDIATTFWGKQYFLDFNGEIRQDLGQTSMNDTYKMSNGWITQVYPEIADETLLPFADRIGAVAGYLSSQSIPMIFMMAPFNVDKYDPRLPEGVTDFTNDNADRFVDMLLQRGIEVIDIREALHEDGIDTSRMMYRTDHHWNTDAGLYAYQKLLPWLETHLTFDTDPRIADPASYTLRTWPEWHLGTYGQRTSIEFVGSADDFSVYIPNFDTYVRDLETGREGRLEDAFYHMEHLQQRDYESRLTYDNVLGGGDLITKTCVNQMANNGIRMLLISNSFYRAMYPYLLLQFQEVCFTHTSTTSSLSPDVLSQYDVVVFLYEPTVLYDGAAFAFPGY